MCELLSNINDEGNVAWKTLDGAEGEEEQV